MAEDRNHPFKNQKSNESSYSSSRLKPQDKVPKKPVWQGKKASIQTIEEMNSQMSSIVTVKKDTIPREENPYGLKQAS